MASDQLGGRSLPGSESNSTQPPFTDILKAVLFQAPDKIKKKETGLKLFQKIYSDQTASDTSLNFFRGRALRWINILKWATGMQDMREFQDYFNVSDANKAYVKIDMSPNMLGAQFVGTLVDSIAANQEYPSVTAIDQNSVQEKEDKKNHALFRMRNIEKIAGLQESSGLFMENPNAYVPDDEIQAKMHFELEDRIDKEIRIEKKLEKTLSDNKYERIQKRKTIYDFVVHNIGVTKIERAPNGGYCIRIPVCQNLFYTYFIRDSGEIELGYVGEMYNLKIRDLRMLYGESAGIEGGMTEKEIYDLARISTQRNSGLWNFMWREEYFVYNFNRPWDDYSVYVMDGVININLDQYYTNSTDSFGKENYTPKKGVPNPTSEKTSVIKDTKNRWFQGIYAPYASKMIYWGLPTHVILDPDNPKQSLCPYTINIPFNNGMYIPSLFERAMEPLKEYTLAKLKRKQLIAKLRPTGIRIDIESARNIDLGNGNAQPWEEIMRIFDQTGNELWSSKGIDPMSRETPAISNTANDDAVQKIIQLTTMMESCVQEIRTLLGVPAYRDGTDVGDRTAAKLADSQNQSSFNVTDFIPNAHNQLWEETLHKCALIEWQNIVKSGELKDDKNIVNARFRTEIKMKVTAYEQSMMEQYLQKALDAGQISVKDALFVREIPSFKQQQLYLSAVIEKNKKGAEQAQQQQMAQNAQAQQASNEQAAQKESQLQVAKQQFEWNLEMAKLKSQKDNSTITMLGMVISKLGTIPPELAPLLQIFVQNETMQLGQENQDMKDQLAQQYQQKLAAHLASQMSAQQGMQGPPGPAQQPAQQQPQPNQMQQSQQAA